MKNYIINPMYVQLRVSKDVYKRVAEQTKKWKSVSISKDMIFNDNVRPFYEVENKKFSWSGGEFCGEELKGMYEVMSSALLLYRLLCHFKCKVVSEGSQGYKMPWRVTLQHKETKEYLMLSEWKGGCGIWTRYYKTEQLQESFSNDILLLLNELFSKDCPHPYDGCVAGSVA